MSDQIETLLKQQGEAFEAFKASHDEQIKEFETKGGAEKWLLPPAYHCQSEPIHPA